SSSTPRRRSSPMSVADVESPTRRSSPLYRAGRWVGTPFRILWWRFYYAPRLLQILLGLIVLIGCTFGVYGAMKFYGRRAIAMESTVGWREYTVAKDKGDLEGMKAGLDRAIAANPADTLAVRKRHDLEVEEADPEDVELALVLLNHHMKSNRLH